MLATDFAKGHGTGFSNSSSSSSGGGDGTPVSVPTTLPSIAFPHLPPNCQSWLQPFSHTSSIAFLHIPPNCQNWLQPFCHTSSIAFRHLPPNSAKIEGHSHTSSIAFRYLPPNSARTAYATEGPYSVVISTQLSTDAVSALRKFQVLTRLWKQHSVQART